MKDIYASSRPKFGEETVVTRRVTPTQVAETALRLATEWGLMAWTADGEDSAGRSKSRGMTPTEIVQHACDTAAELWAEFEKRDWLLELPLPRTEEQLKTASIAEGK